MKRSEVICSISWNYIGIAWSVCAGLFILPIYVNRIGFKNWGLIALTIAIGGGFAILDIGLSQVLPQEVAKAKALDQDIRGLLRIYFQLYCMLAVAGVLTVFAIAPWLLARWVDNEGMEASKAYLVLAFGVAQYGLQFANGFSAACWLGSGDSKRLNIRIIYFGLFKHGLTLLSVVLVPFSPLAYVVPMALGAGFEFFFNSRSVFGAGGAYGRWSELARSSAGTLLKLSPFGAALLLGAATSQSDRWILSRELSSSDFAKYSLVCGLGLAVFQLQNPVVRAFIPKIAATNLIGASSCIAEFAGVVFVVFVIPVIIAIVFAKQLLHAWMPGLDSVSCVNVFRCILLAAILNVTYQYIYQRLVAGKKSMAVLFINLLAATAILFYWLLMPRPLEMAAGGWMWVAIGSIQLASGILLYRRRA